LPAPASTRRARQTGQSTAAGAFPARARFRKSDLLRRLFESVLQRCIVEGLVGGKGFAVDASLIQADASDRNRAEGAASLPPEAAGGAVDESLAVLDDAAFDAASEVTPKFIALADPATRWTGAHRGPAFYAHSANYLVDADHDRCRLDIDNEWSDFICRPGNRIRRARGPPRTGQRVSAVAPLLASHDPALLQDRPGRMDRMAGIRSQIFFGS
jgi:hypothetical protein